MFHFFFCLLRSLGYVTLFVPFSKFFSVSQAEHRLSEVPLLLQTLSDFPFHCHDLFKRISLNFFKFRWFCPQCLQRAIQTDWRLARSDNWGSSINISISIVVVVIVVVSVMTLRTVKNLNITIKTGNGNTVSTFVAPFY